MSRKKHSPQPPAADLVPLGPALNWTEEELDELCQIDSEDLAEAQQWAADNSPDLAGLLDAQPAKPHQRK